MTEQSPIDIPARAPVHSDGLVFAYRASTVKVRDDGYALRADLEPGSFAIADERRYRLEQFHVHSPGEHTLAGSRSVMEMHLVHGDEEGKIMVVGVLLEEGPPNMALESVLVGAQAKLHPIDLLPEDRSYVAYRGSLTAPPYSGDVAWRMLVHPIGLSPEQAARLRAIHHGNARRIQPLGSRSFG